ncbi:hypothetical protein [Bailinhaonella thermotolerans]|uniref:Uncharacterized protein n=1 Tax=Bailinhaonella thermotolerans TaxID=1070861 RepID=A0A3A4A9W0_9ACTN|nr:hypothetical protein [Bailinhaonella thermotolerans]RJL24829.1 hypothetical protein D5H75_29055 [Bailinhaonella thermotolerans]
MTSSRMRPVFDLTPARWVVDGVGDFGAGVGALVPAGFERYARILYPATRDDDRPVRWADVAAWAGRTLHPRAQFASISRPAPGAGTGDPPFDEPPGAGDPRPELLTALCEVLARHTRTAERCWICLWDGYAFLQPSAWGSIVAFMTEEKPGEWSAGPDAGDSLELTASLAPPDEDEGEGAGSDSGSAGGPAGEPREPGDAPFPPEVLNGPKVELPGREYILLEGPLDAVREPDWDEIWSQAPNLFWPDDRAWCVNVEIDLDSAYLGGPAALVEDLLADPRLEAFPVEITDPITFGSDDVNR